MKKLICITITLAVLLGTLSMPAWAAGDRESRIAQCRQNMDTAHQMAECARALGYPEDYVVIREAGRIWNENNDRRKELLAQPRYTEEDLDLLARLVYAEAGCSWFPDWVQRAVASVVLNRVNSPAYPNTIREVIYQPGQYGPAWSGSIHNTPSQQVMDNCRYVLENGSTLPAGVLGQNGTATGNGIHSFYYDSILGSTIYFTYG